MWALALAAAAALGAGRAQPGGWTLDVKPVWSPAQAESGQPQLTVSERGVLLSWIERYGSNAFLKFAERTPDGWSEPMTVASGTDWFINWADVPSVLRLPDGTIAAHWLQRSGGGTYAYDVRLAFSKDNGQTWTPPASPHDDGTRTEHGFVSMFAMPGAKSELGLIWLDGRAMSGSGHGGPARHGAGGGRGQAGHAAGGDMALRFATYVTGGAKTSETVVDSRVCECCSTTATVTADGPLVAFRNRSDDEVRDIQVSRLEGGKWSAPVSVHEDGWRIAACPVNGPMLSARGNDVAIAWFTAKGDTPQALAAFSQDGGRTFSEPIRLDDTAALGRVDILLLPDGSAVASYVEHADGRARFNIRRIDRAGRRSNPITVAGIEDGRASGYPRIAVHGNELVFAWVERSQPPVQALLVKTAVASLPR